VEGANVCLRLVVAGQDASVGKELRRRHRVGASNAYYWNNVGLADRLGGSG
jgi:hypothetical protein